MPRTRRGSTGRESGWLNISDGNSTSGDLAWQSKTIDFPILAFDTQYNAIEIYKVQVDQVTGNNGAFLVIGTKSYTGTTTSVLTVSADRTTVFSCSIPTGITSQIFDLTDDQGNGPMLPADRLTWSVKNSSATAQSFVVRFFYRLKKVSDKDMITMLNQYVVQVGT